MKKIDFLKTYLKTADVHAVRLNAALTKSKAFFPITAQSLEKLSDEHVAVLDMLTTRFGKLQDVIGAKIFPLILDLLGENTLSFRDNLNKLEKLQVIESARWWMKIRELRNELTHDYPDEYDSLAISLNQLIPYVDELLVRWRVLAQTCSTLLKK